MLTLQNKTAVIGLIELTNFLGHDLAQNFILNYKNILKTDGINAIIPCYSVDQLQKYNELLVNYRLDRFIAVYNERSQ